MLAAFDGKDAIVRCLLACPDIRVDLVNNEGQTARDIAKQEGHETIVRMIDSYSRTP